MSFTNEAVGGGSDGSIENIEAGLPLWMQEDDIENAYDEIWEQIAQIKDPPVASMYPVSTASLEDHRRFFVEFESHATIEDIIAVVGIVGGALKRLRYQS